MSIADVPPIPPLSAPVGRAAGRPGVGFGDVERTADALLREGQRPTIERVRARLGRGSPNTIQPLLDRWWTTLAARLDAGPAALHRIPESVAHIIEALWLQLLAEARVRAAQEQSAEATAQSESRQQLEVRSYVLSLREGELDERVRQREQEITRLRRELDTVATLLRRSLADHAQQQSRRAINTGGTVRRPRQNKAAPSRQKEPTRTAQSRAPTRRRHAGTTTPRQKKAAKRVSLSRRRASRSPPRRR